MLRYLTKMSCLLYLLCGSVLATSYSINMNVSGGNCAQITNCYSTDSIDMRSRYSVVQPQVQNQLNGHVTFSGLDDMSQQAQMQLFYTGFAEIVEGSGMKLSASLLVDNPFFNTSNPLFSFYDQQNGLGNNPAGVPYHVTMQLFLAYFDDVQVIADEPVQNVEITLVAKASQGYQGDGFRSALTAYGVTSLQNYFQIDSSSTGTLIDDSEIAIFEVENGMINISLDWGNYFHIDLSSGSDVKLQNISHRIEFGDIKGRNTAGEEVAVTLVGARGRIYGAGQ